MSFTPCQQCNNPGYCVNNMYCVIKAVQDQVNVAGNRFKESIAQTVIEDREASHGNYVTQADLAQQLKSIFHDEKGWLNLNSAQRESLDMIAVKISRILNGDPNNPDHWTDCAGYATLVSNLLTKGTHL